MARITSPTGEQMPDTDNPGRLAYYERRGYTIERDDAPEDDDGHAGTEVPDGDPTGEWTVAQLRAFAKAHDVDLGGATRKDDILAALTVTTDDAGEDKSDDGGTPAA